MFLTNSHLAPRKLLDAVSCKCLPLFRQPVQLEHCVHVDRPDHR